VAFFLSIFQSERYAHIEHHIHEATIPSYIDFSYWWVNYTRYNDTESHFLFPPEEYRELMLVRPLDMFGEVTDKDGELAANLWFSMRFFLQNTSARWFYRGNDDSIINFDAIGPFLTRLESAYDPFREFVFLGNCIHNEFWTFPQGGSGYLISRAGVKQLEPMRRQFMYTLKKPEDIAFEAFFESLGVNMTMITSPNFCGHSFGEDSLDKIRRRAWAEFGECPMIEGLSGQFCKPFLAPVRNIVFYHEWNRSLGEALENAKAVARADESVLWYMDGKWPHVCRRARSQSR
jgi:hypothetical protein